MDQITLTMETIVDEAIRLLNEEGLDGVSLRKLAARLGVKAPSLYWHFPDKAALMSALMERIFNGCLDSVPDSRDWQVWMRSFGSVLWRTQQSVRDFGRLITTTDVPAAQLARTAERIRSRMRGRNLPEEDAMRLQATIQALMTGWSAFAQAPYAKTLARTLDFEAMAMQDLETIIAGQAGKLRRRRRARTAR
jgi:TetR/AcrR family tetracycline transcriptional repressor